MTADTVPRGFYSVKILKIRSRRKFPAVSASVFTWPLGRVEVSHLHPETCGAEVLSLLQITAWVTSIDFPTSSYTTSLSS